MPLPQRHDAHLHVKELVSRNLVCSRLVHNPEMVEELQDGVEYVKIHRNAQTQYQYYTIHSRPKIKASHTLIKLKVLKCNLWQHEAHLTSTKAFQCTKGFL